MKRSDDAASTEDRRTRVVPSQPAPPDDFVDTDADAAAPVVDAAAAHVAVADAAAVDAAAVDAALDIAGVDAAGVDVATPGAAAVDVGALEEPAELDQRGQDILAFEKRWWKHAGSKEQAIRDTFGLSATRYYQLLNGLLDDPLALAHDPVTVQRLRRLRATRTRSRGSARQ